MKLLGAFARSLLPSLLGLLLGCYVASVFITLAHAIETGSLLAWAKTPPGISLIISMYALAIAAPAVLMIGWPVYALLLHKGHATYFTSAYLPLIFALLAAVSDSAGFAVLVAVYALCIAWITHWLQLRMDKLIGLKPIRDMGRAS